MLLRLTVRPRRERVRRPAVGLATGNLERRVGSVSDLPCPLTRELQSELRADVPVLALTEGYLVYSLDIPHRNRGQHVIANRRFLGSILFCETVRTLYACIFVTDVSRGGELQHAAVGPCRTAAIQFLCGRGMRRVRRLTPVAVSLEYSALLTISSGQQHFQ